MATIENSEIVEACQKGFKDLELQDGGYYPSKHDKKVFELVSKEFSITEEEVIRIYDEYTKHAFSHVGKCFNKSCRIEYYVLKHVISPFLRRIKRQTYLDVCILSLDGVLVAKPSVGVPPEELKSLW